MDRTETQTHAVAGASPIDRWPDETLPKRCERAEWMAVHGPEHPMYDIVKESCLSCLGDLDGRIYTAIPDNVPWELARLLLDTTEQIISAQTEVARLRKAEALIEDLTQAIVAAIRKVDGT